MRTQPMSYSSACRRTSSSNAAGLPRSIHYSRWAVLTDARFTALRRRAASSRQSGGFLLCPRFSNSVGFVVPSVRSG